MDVSEMTEEEFAAHELQVKRDRERRDNLARIPEEIAAMAAKYREGGGEESALTDAISTD